MDTNFYVVEKINSKDQKIIWRFKILQRGNYIFRTTNSTSNW